MKKVLLIDDEVDALNFLSEYLTRLGLQVETVSNSAHAVEKACAFKPDAVFLDIRMAPVDGMAVLAELRERKLTARIIMLTAESSPKLLEKSLQLGARGFLVKPFRLKDLEAEVRHILSGDQA